ncbi:hypothetical protein HS121_17485 [bacterium]|nr:hypothetical protein [bacterium]
MDDWKRWVAAIWVAAALAAWVESLPLPVNDNLTVPFSAAAVLFAAEFVSAENLREVNGWYVVVAILGNGILASILTSFRIVQGSATGRECSLGRFSGSVPGGSATWC